MTSVPTDQRWFWTQDWQTGEREASQEIAAGARFQSVVISQFVVDLTAGTFRPGLRIKRVRSTAKIWELTWAPDGRATFEYGPEITSGAPHVVWRRVGTHGIVQRP